MEIYFFIKAVIFHRLYFYAAKWRPVPDRAPFCMLILINSENIAKSDDAIIPFQEITPVPNEPALIP